LNAQTPVVRLDDVGEQTHDGRRGIEVAAGLAFGAGELAEEKWLTPNHVRSGR